MKKNLSFLFLLFSFLLTYSQVIEAPDSIKGGFNQCVISEYKGIGGNIDTLNTAKLTNANYNSEGRKTAEVNYIDNSLSLRIYYTYNESGDVLVADSTYREFGFVYYDKYFYENKKLVLHERWSDENSQFPNAAFAKWTNTYDKDGKLMMEKYWTYDLSFNYDYTYTYNKEGQLIKLISVGLYDFNNYEILYENNSSGKRVKSQKFSEENKLLSCDSMVYDSSGRKTEKYLFTKDKTLTNIETSFYDSQGRETEFTRYIKDKAGNQISNNTTLKMIELKKISSYNESGKLTEEKFSTETGGISISRKTYKYDTYGNLVELIRYNANDEIATKTLYVFSK